MLQLNNINVSFHKGTVDEMQLFRDFSFSVKKGEFVSIVGSNGSGKTTMLNLICGTLQPDSGHILLGGQDITHLPEYKRSRRIARVFQDPKLGTSSHLTVLENFALADNKNKPFTLGRAVDPKRVDTYRALLEQCSMGLEDRLHTQMGNLSGGQRQAIAMVMAGMTQAELLILDEHTAALDPKSAETVMELTDKLVKSHDMTAVMVTHNLRFATNYGSRLVMMHDGGIVIDKAGEEKQALQIPDLLETFNAISIECGN